MSTHNTSDHTPLDGVTLDGTTTQQQTVILMKGQRGLSMIWTWTGTLAASLGLEISNNYNEQRPGLARWTPVTDSSLVAQLSSGAPNGTAGSSSLQISPIHCRAVRFTANRSGSSGTFSLDVSRA